MDQVLLTLTVIVALSLAGAVLAQLVPRKAVPSTVFLVLAGALLGPFGAGLIEMSEPVHLLGELGLAFLFLLAGYEIDIDDLRSKPGVVAAGTWMVSFGVALGVVAITRQLNLGSPRSSAIAIAATSTALGTLLPILQDRGQLKSAVGRTVLAHGTYGEIFPIIAISLLLSGRTTAQSLIMLAVFAALAVASALFGKRLRGLGQRAIARIEVTPETVILIAVRFAVVLLVGLVTLAGLMGLDVVLGAFAAGFALRHVIPEEREELSLRLDGVGHGFFIPVFFVVSGAGINLGVITQKPATIAAMVAFILLVRTLPVFASTYVPGVGQSMKMRERITAAIYTATSLPIIVAVAHIAVASGSMSEQLGSVLVAAGAATVFLMPLISSLTCRIAEVHPLETAHEILRHPSRISSVLQRRLHEQREQAAARATPDSPGNTGPSNNGDGDSSNDGNSGNNSDSHDSSNNAGGGVAGR